MQQGISKWVGVGSLAQVAMIVAGQYSAFVRDNVFALGGMAISLIAGALWANAFARGRGDGAKGGAIVGGGCALVGIIVGVLLGNTEPMILAIGTISSAVTGAVGGALAARSR